MSRISSQSLRDFGVQAQAQQNAGLFGYLNDNIMACIFDFLPLYYDQRALINSCYLLHGWAIKLIKRSVIYMRYLDYCTFEQHTENINGECIILLPETNDYELLASFEHLEYFEIHGTDSVNLDMIPTLKTIKTLCCYDLAMTRIGSSISCTQYDNPGLSPKHIPPNLQCLILHKCQTDFTDFRKKRASGEKQMPNITRLELYDVPDIICCTYFPELMSIIIHNSHVLYVESCKKLKPANIITS
jgi:hypothetical protein